MLHASDTRTPRQRRRSANLVRILDAAMQVVIEGGFDALSMHRLAKELDYTPGALYRYYPSKDVLISALTARVLRELAADIEATVAALPPDRPAARVAGVIFAYRRLAREAPNRFGMLSMLAAEPRTLVPDPDDAAPALAALVGALQPLVVALDRAAQAGHLHPGSAQDRALIAFGAVHGLLQLRKQENRGPALFDLDPLVQSGLHALLVGWGAPPDSVARDLDLAARVVAGDSP